MSYTTKTDCWGPTCYYDGKGRLIGRESTTLGGKRIIKDTNGTVIGRLGMDLILPVLYIRFGHNEYQILG